MSGVPLGPPRDRSFRRRFPWLRLFDAARLSCDGRKIILGALGLIALWAGWLFLDLIFPRSADGMPPSAALSHRVGIANPGAIESLDGLGSIQEAAWLITVPIRAPMVPVRDFFTVDVGQWRFGHSLLAGLWGILVWSIFGCAIARVALVEIATGERPGILSSLRFAARRTVALVGAPATPLFGIVLLVIPCAVLGLLYNDPAGIGGVLGGVLGFLPLILGVFMTLILVGLLASWPLMVAAIAAENEDAFGALSRAYGYVYQKTLRYVGGTFVCWVVGAVVLLFVGFFARWTIRMAAWGLAIGGPDSIINAYWLESGFMSTGPSPVHNFWRNVVSLFALGWTFSYVWSAVSVLYLLLRHDVDGASIEAVFLPGPANEMLLPLRGAAIPTENEAPPSS